jgi:hypothetical protein
VWYAQNPNQTTQTAQDLLQRYHDVNGKLTVQRWSVLDHQAQAQAQHLTQADSIVFEYGSRQPQVMTAADEQTFTTSLLRLVTNRAPRAYFLTGHGEGGIESTAQNGNSFVGVKDALSKQGITAVPLNLATGGAPVISIPGASPGAGASPQAQASPAAPASPSPQAAGSPGPSPSATAVTATAIPPDADEVVILDPRTNLSKEELAALSDYLAKGGRVLVASGAFEKNNLNDLVGKYGLSFGGGVVLDQQLALRSAGADVLLVDRWAQSLVTTGLDPQRSVLVLMAPVEGKAASGFNETTLVATKDDACERTDASLSTGQCLAQDKKGPFNLIATLEQTGVKEGDKPARLVVMGGARFASDGFLSQFQSQPQNLSFMVNAVNWLAGQDKVISIPPRQASPETVFLSAAQRAIIYPGFFIFVPLLVAAAGVYVYVRNRG